MTEVPEGFAPTYYGSVARDESTIYQCVIRGKRLLDGKRPRWMSYIDLDELKTSNSFPVDLLRQINKCNETPENHWPYRMELTSLGLSVENCGDVEYGFNCKHGLSPEHSRQEMEILKERWLRVIETGMRPRKSGMCFDIPCKRVECEGSKRAYVMGSCGEVGDIFILKCPICQRLHYIEIVPLEGSCKPEVRIVRENGRVEEKE